MKKSHMDVTEEPKDRYQTHYATKTKTKPSKQSTLELFEWMKDRKKDCSFKVISCDVTKTCLTGIVACYTLLENFSMKDILGLPYAFKSTSCRSFVLWQSLMDQILEINKSVVQLASSFSKLRLQPDTDFGSVSPFEVLANVIEDIANLMSTGILVA